jgi:DNA polymerase III subunit epsilon
VVGQNKNMTTRQLIAGIDIETTGLMQSDGHRIIEIAVLIYDLEKESYIGKYVQRVNPLRPIDPKAQEVHGISFEELSECPTWEDVAPKLLKVVNNVNVGLIAHNGDGFDMPFINAELMRIGLPIITLPTVDTMLQGRWATPNGKYPSLKELCFSCGVDYDIEQAHAAEYDVRVMVDSFFKVYKDGFFNFINKESNN